VMLDKWGVQDFEKIRLAVETTSPTFSRSAERIWDGTSC
jgi:hypothetical protein